MPDFAHRIQKSAPREDPRPADVVPPAPGGRPRVGIGLGDGWRRHAPAAWTADWRPERFELPDGWTEVVTMGSGPPLVLLPPLPGFKEAWLACAAPLARTFRVITFDLRAGFDGRPSWDALLDDLRRILDHHAPESAGVVGHSLGGALAQRWALAAPDRVRALVLSSSFARVTDPRGNLYARYVEQPIVLATQRLFPEPIARALARRFAARGAWVYDTHCDAAVLDFVRFCIRDLRIAHARTAVSLALAHDTRAALPGLIPPTRIVVGELESVFAREAAAELQRLLPSSSFAASPGASHLHPLSSPDWLVERIVEWMRDAPDVRAPRAQPG